MLGYHDTEWGFPVTDDVRLFEKLSLEGFQAGLSWLTILRKRENFRSAFAGFDFHKVAGFEEAGCRFDCSTTPESSAIAARSKRPINNAAETMDLIDEFGSLAAYVWGYAPDRPEAPVDIPSITPESTAMSKDLKRRGWRFVGPTTVYAFMQAMGLVNDHVEGCAVRPRAERHTLSDAATMTDTQKVRWRSIALPTEHGGWGFTLEPILLGLLVAPTWAGFGLAAATAAVFLARRPVKLVSTDLVRKRRLPRTRMALSFALGYGVLAAAGMVLAVLAADGPFWWPLMVAIPFAAISLRADAQSRNRALLPELAGGIAMGSAAAAIAMAADWDWAPAFGLWLVLAARSYAAIIFARAQVRRRQRPAATIGRGSMAAQVAAILVVSLAAALAIVPLLSALAIFLLGAGCLLQPGQTTRACQDGGLDPDAVRLDGRRSYCDRCFDRLVEDRACVEADHSRFLDFGCLLVDDRRLGGGQAGDRHPEGRAAHVVEPQPVAEVDRLADRLRAHRRYRPRGPDGLARPSSTAICINLPTPASSMEAKGFSARIPSLR